MISYPKKLLKPVLDYFYKVEKELLKRKSELGKEDPFVDSGRLNDNASDDTEAAEQWGHERARALTEETEKALERVREAMKRVNEGTYGQCIECKGMIDTDRLKIDPTAGLCMKCAKKSK